MFPFKTSEVLLSVRAPGRSIFSVQNYCSFVPVRQQQQQQQKVSNSTISPGGGYYIFRALGQQHAAAVFTK